MSQRHGCSSGRGGWVGVVLLVTACAPTAQVAIPDEDPFSAADSLAAAQADLAYAEAWLAGGADPVMATLHEDAVIVPSGREALEGAESIRGWWFPPDSPPTNVHRYDVDQQEVGGSGSLAFARGSFELAFEYDGTEYESGGTYLSLLRPDEAGNWRIAYRMWSDR